MNTRSHDIDVELGNLLRERRVSLGLTVQDVAQITKVPCRQIEKYENAENRLSVVRLHEIASAIGVRASALLRNAESRVQAQETGKATADVAALQTYEHRLSLAIRSCGDEDLIRAIVNLVEATVVGAPGR